MRYAKYLGQLFVMGLAAGLGTGIGVGTGLTIVFRADDVLKEKSKKDDWELKATKVEENDK